MKGKALIVVAVVLGVIVVIMINSRMSALEAKANPPRKTFYRAVTDIYPGATVNSLVGGANALLEKVEDIPAEFARSYPDAFDEEELTWAGAKAVARPIRAGQFLTMSHLKPYSAAEIRARIKPGWIAAGIQVTAETSVGYLLAPGDIVDVYLVRTRQDAEAEGGVAVESIKVGEDLTIFATDSTMQQDDGTLIKPRGQSYSIVTIAAEPEKVTRLLEARTRGALTLVLKARAAEG